MPDTTGRPAPMTKQELEIWGRIGQLIGWGKSGLHTIPSDDPGNEPDGKYYLMDVENVDRMADDIINVIRELAPVAALTERAEKAEAERDKAYRSRDGMARLLHRYESITTAWTRGMYSARIDCLRGDVKAAVNCLSEGLDGYDGTEWDGTETGTEWWERTKAEEGLPASPADEPAATT